MKFQMWYFFVCEMFMNDFFPDPGTIYVTDGTNWQDEHKRKMCGSYKRGIVCVCGGGGRLTARIILSRSSKLCN